VRTLILFSICVAFATVPYLEAKLDGVELRKPILRATAGWCVGMITCWVLVRVVGIFDNWGQ